MTKKLLILMIGSLSLFLSACADKIETQQTPVKRPTPRVASDTQVTADGALQIENFKIKIATGIISQLQHTSNNALFNVAITGTINDKANFQLANSVEGNGQGGIQGSQPSFYQDGSASMIAISKCSGAQDNSCNTAYMKITLMITGGSGSNITVQSYRVIGVQISSGLASDQILVTNYEENENPTLDDIENSFFSQGF